MIARSVMAALVLLAAGDAEAWFWCDDQGCAALPGSPPHCWRSRPRLALAPARSQGEITLPATHPPHDLHVGRVGIP
jgi:hypothetical protein